jgi:hypothetical protein
LEVGDFILSVSPDNSNCPDKDESRIAYLPLLQKNESLPLCTEWNMAALMKIQWHNASGNLRFIIIRQFQSDLCPAAPGERNALNAFLVQRLERDDWANKPIFACSPTLGKVIKGQPFPDPPLPPNVVRAQPSLDIEHESAAEAYLWSPGYTVQQVFHDDKCGISTQGNAYKLLFKSQD